MPVDLPNTTRSINELLLLDDDYSGSNSADGSSGGGSGGGNTNPAAPLDPRCAIEVVGAANPTFTHNTLSLIHISEPTRLLSISYAVFCLKKKTNKTTKNI
eukprot:TRINITY_DN27031_c0_g1_i1.p1 TRINITY_DN27031_c0_g1~~TRINITY_DN27031_c0_g1_i1.p1  ORF type:complete len:101 (-),score=20.55 TRINITY_DN27031_c0_g1_i1:26-328(-)